MGWFDRLRKHLFGDPGLDRGQGSVSQRIARGAYWAMVGEVSVKVITLASSIWIARLLGPEGFGTFGIIQSTLGVFGVLAGFGLGSTVIKHVAGYAGTEPARAGALIMLTVLIAAITSALMIAVLVTLAPWLAEHSLNRPELSGLLALGSLMLAGLVVGGVLNAALNGFEAFRSLARLRVLNGLFGSLATLVLVWAYGVNGAVMALVVAALAGLLLSAMALRLQLRQRGIPLVFGSGIWRDRGLLHKFALPALVSSQLVVPTIWITNTFLVQQADGYAQFGLFNAANQWRTLVVFLPSMLASAMLPILADTWARKADGEFSQAIGVNLRTVWILALPMMLLVVALGPELGWLFGEQYQGVERLLPYLMASTFFTVICSPAGAAMTAAGYMWWGACMNFGWACLLVGAAWVLVPRHGGAGLAMAYAFAYLLHTVWTMGFVRFRVARDIFSAVARLAVFTALLLGAMLVVNEWSGVLQRSGFALLALLSLLPLGRDTVKLLGKLQVQPHAGEEI